MNDPCCPHCGGPVSVAGHTTHYYLCPKCGPVDPVPRLVKVFAGDGPLLGQAPRETDGAIQRQDGAL